MYKKNAIIYFVKYPTPGKVKTRLARTVGDKKAALLYKELAEKNFLTLKQCKETELIVFFDPPEDLVNVHWWLAGADQYIPQEGSTLGERLINAFKWAFDNGFRKVTAVGSDILQMTTTIADQSFVALKEVDVVIGPAKDGGYYLIGLSSNRPSLFEGIDWSTSKVLSQTYQVINKLKLKYHTLCPLDDLDEIKLARAPSPWRGAGGSKRRTTHEFINGELKKRRG